MWAMLTNHLEPVLLMILGAVATSTDVLMFTRDLVKAAKEESRILERERDTEQRRSDQKGFDE